MGMEDKNKSIPSTPSLEEQVRGLRIALAKVKQENIQLKQALLQVEAQNLNEFMTETDKKFPAPETKGESEKGNF